MQRLAVLEGKQQPILALVSGTDQMTTAAVTPAKPKLPEASAPSAELMGETPEVTLAEASAKKFTDRVPPEAETQPVAKIVAASAAPEEGEKILAVETVPEEPAAEAAAPAEETTETASAPETADAPKITGWSVQLASAATEDAAWSTWKKMKARNKALAAKEPVVVRADLGTKGIFYRVRLVGFDTQNAANSECAKLKSKGVRCYISKAAS